jgi:glycolate oxidase FAD binding subunit
MGDPASGVVEDAQDLTAHLSGQVRKAAAAGTPLRIVGGDTKAFYGRQVEVGRRLEVASHRGVTQYDPSELVIVARSGTPLAEVEARLAEQGQMLAFEPPRLGAASTIGGVVAAGLSGPRRPFAGAVRDFLLGATILDGRGEALRFGGQVFKNVAGFDLFRPMAGALGSLGVILSVALRVAPRPRRETALALEMDADAARSWLAERMRGPAPLSGAFHDGARLHLRLSGGEAGVAAARADLGGDDEPLGVWDDICDLRHPALAGERPLWRLTLPQTAPIPAVGDVVAWDWAGAQVWLAADAPPQAVWDGAAAVGGHATHWRGAGAGEAVFQPLPPHLFALHQRLKAALDPGGILNPGRLYEGF